MEITRSKIGITELASGSKAIVVGYNTVYGGYIGKLVKKGLIVGKVLTIVELNSVEKTVKIIIDGQPVTLRKPEAEALYVKLLENDEN